MSQIKVVFFHPYFRDGGVEKTNLRLSRIFKDLNFDISFLFLDLKSPFLKEILSLNIELVKINRKRTLYTMFDIIKFLNRESYKYKYVIAIGCQNFANIVLVSGKVFLERNIRIILTERSFPEVALNRTLKTRAIKILMRMFYKYADVVVANSEATANFLREKVNKNTYCIYNPTIISLDSLKEQVQKLVNHEWFIKKEKPIVIGVGRLTKEKDFETLIKAFALVKKEIDARLVILGEGEERAKLEKLVKKLGLQNSVWMPGFVNNPYKYIAKADVFVLSSLYEGLPNVLIEAIAVGTPVISTDCLSGPREILLDGKGGDLVNVGDYYSLAKSIIKYLKNPQYAKQKWQIAFNHLNRFSFENIKHKWIELLNNIGIEL